MQIRRPTPSLALFATGRHRQMGQSRDKAFGFHLDLTLSVTITTSHRSTSRGKLVLRLPKFDLSARTVALLGQSTMKTVSLAKLKAKLCSISFGIQLAQSKPSADSQNHAS